MFAVVFPGQGSQKPGMGRAFYEHFAESRAVFEAVGSATGRDIAALCFESDDDTLRQTQNAQIALYTAGLAAYAALKVRLEGWTPKAAAGHSVGEYTAIAAAGMITVQDGARLVQLRGELMAASGSVRPGTMAAVLGLEKSEVERVCREASTSSEVVVVANDNCPGQLAISGDVAAVERASKALAEAGAKRVLPLNVSGAFHSPLMEEPAQKMAAALHQTRFAASPENIIVYSNVTAEPVDLPAGWPVLLETQLKSPVRWTESIRHMRRDEVEVFVECGGGEVLSGLIRRIDGVGKTLKAADPESLEAAVAELHRLRAGV